MRDGHATVVGSEPRHTTLLALVWELGGQIESPEAIARHTSQLIARGRVVLTGNFRGCRIELGGTPAERRHGGGSSAGFHDEARGSVADERHPR